MIRTTRRAFLGYGGAAACVCGRPAHAADPRPKPAVTPRLQPAAYAQVRLGDGPMLSQRAHQHDLFMGLDNDRLLKPFRVRAGLPAPGPDMGGWYDQSDDFVIDTHDWSKTNWHGYIPGHSFGQYLSGLARLYAVTGDAATRAKVASLVRDYAPTISPRFFDGYTLPAYTYDKIVIGLIDAYRYADVKEAAGALDRVTDAALPYLPERALTREQRRKLPYTSEAQIWDEPYTLPENLFKAWRLGLGQRYYDLAVRYLQDEALFDPLAQGVSPLKGKHAYSHVNALSSAIEAYLATGDETYLRAAANGFAFIERQSFATGGWGPNETLIGPDDDDALLTSLSQTHSSFETPCGAYGHFKITRSLLRLTGDSHYGDSMERVLYNTILGALPTTPEGKTFYYSDYNRTAGKFYRPELWPCCSGTFIQLTADYGVSAYLSDARAVYVNLYLPSDLQTEIGGVGVRLRQTTDYPLADTVRIDVQPERPARFTLALRMPAWAGPATRVTINGEAVPVAPGRFLRLERLWRAGDAVEIRFDMGLRLEALNAAHPDVVAVMTGPLVLMPLVESGAAPDAALSRDSLLAARRTGPAQWRVNGPQGPLTLAPFMAIGGETYRLYSRAV